MKKILIVAGGTGGHIFPALAVANELQNRAVEVHWLGSLGGMENNIISGIFPIYLINMKGIRGKGWINLLLSPVQLLRATLQALKIMRQVKPDAVLGMGGFVSGPGGIAASILQLPLVIHEQNSKAGYANRLLAKMAKQVLCAFPDVFKKSKKVFLVGNPVRADITALASPEARFHTRNPQEIRVLILGGSRGAQAINQLILKMLEFLPKDQSISLTIWHQTGDADFAAVKAAYEKIGQSAKVEKFIINMNEAYAWADLAICRAGALTVAELAAVGLGSILIPFPYAVDNHQYYNGLYLERAGAAILIEQKSVHAAELARILLALANDRKKLLSMAQNAQHLAHPKASKKVADILMNY